MLRFPSLVAALLVAAAPGASLAHPPEAGEAPGPHSPAPPPAPAGVVDAFHTALGRGDGAGALALLAEEALVFEAGGVERSRAQYAAEHLAADAAFAQAVRSTTSRRTGAQHGDTAWIATEGRTTGSYKGKAIDSLSTETMVLRRQGSRWVIVHIHWSSRPAPKDVPVPERSQP